MKKSQPTRRTALTFAAAALPMNAQTRKPAHPVVRFEIGCTDIARTQKFFADLFGWETKRNGIAASIESETGIQGGMTALGHEPQHYTIFYVEVDEIQPYLDKAVSLGGKVLVPAIKIPTGFFAWFADPDGNTIGLLKRT